MSCRQVAAGLAGLIALSSALGGCALPQHKDVASPAKRAMYPLAAQAVLDHYNRVRASVDSDVDLAPLVEIEGGSLLDIDSGAIYLRQRLALGAKVVKLAATRDIESGQFESYPIWFVARTTVPGYGEQVLALFERRSATDPWLLVEAPRLAVSTDVSAAAVAEGGGVVIYDFAEDTWSDGADSDLSRTPQELADDYATVLTDPGSRRAATFVDDSFLIQMRGIANAQPTRNVSFSQRWKALPVRHALRLMDGSALVFATLERREHYRVQRGHSLDFTGVEAAAYFTAPVEREAALRYLHQVVLLAPSGGKPLVIGQHGGLVAATGD